MIITALELLLEDVKKMNKSASKDANNRVGSASRRTIRHRARGREEALADVERLIERRIKEYSEDEVEETDTKTETEEKTETDTKTETEEKKEDGGDRSD